LREFSFEGWTCICSTAINVKVVGVASLACLCLLIQLPGIQWYPGIPLEQKAERGGGAEMRARSFIAILSNENEALPGFLIKT
jgi:hypothetical protein